MLFHPGILMLLVWFSATFSFFALPYVFTYRTVQIEALLVLFLYIFFFCFFAFLASPIKRISGRKYKFDVDFYIVGTLLKFVCFFAVLMFVFDMLQRDAFNFAALTQYRTNQAQALLHGESSSSSIYFKLAFLTYPASYSYVAISLIAAKRIPWMKVAFFGAAPSVLAAFLMGGRTPILCLLFISAFSIYIRSIYCFSSEKIKNNNVYFWRCIVFLFILLCALIYFSKVFILRAQSVGGAGEMLQLAGSIWGVTFDGAVADALVNVVGTEVTYLILVFCWYFNQGILISNDVFSLYEGDYLWGAYGIDLISAIVRRVDPIWLSARFDELLSLKVYGFFPSAFGSLFIDFGFFGLIVTAFWGWISGFVYSKVQGSADVRYLVLFAFVIMGVVFSLINTPFGFGNGLIIYMWLFVALGFLRSQPQAIDPDSHR